MVRRIGFDDDDEGSGAVRRRGQVWREERIVTTHRHEPTTPETRARRLAERNLQRVGIEPADDRGGAGHGGGFGRILRNPIVLILGFLLFHVFFIAFLIIRAIWLARGGRGPDVDARRA